MHVYFDIYIYTSLAEETSSPASSTIRSLQQQLADAMQTITEMKGQGHESTPKGSKPAHESTPHSTTSQKTPAPKTAAIMPGGKSDEAPGHKSGLPFHFFMRMGFRINKNP